MFHVTFLLFSIKKKENYNFTRGVVFSHLSSHPLPTSLWRKYGLNGIHRRLLIHLTCCFNIVDAWSAFSMNMSSRNKSENLNAGHNPCFPYASSMPRWMSLFLSEFFENMSLELPLWQQSFFRFSRLSLFVSSTHPSLWNFRNCESTVISVSWYFAPNT